MQEIGSEFWDVPVTREKKVFPESTQWFLSGRSALQAIIKNLKKCHSVAIPSWCCDSVIKPFWDAGIKVSFYPVFWEDGLIQQVKLDCDALFLMDYFGYAGELPNLMDYRGTIIRDVTHSFFSASYSDADYYFGSLRKWCGVWTGGYAWNKDGHTFVMETSEDYGYTATREKAMQLKNSYIHGCGVYDKAYLEIYEEAEQILNKVGIAPAADRDICLANSLDAQLICSRRRNNADVLREALSDWLIFPKMKKTDCPMFVPVFVPDGRRDELQQYLKNNRIYCPIHWAVSKYHILNEQTESLYKNELSLVCDQRYSENDMKREVDLIRAFRKGK